MKIENMQIKVTRSNDNINKKKLYSILCDIIDRENSKQNYEEVDIYEENLVERSRSLSSLS